MSKATIFLFNQRQYKNAKFSKKSHMDFVEPGRIIKFVYGDPDSSSPAYMIGKILTVYKQGVEAVNNVNGGSHTIRWNAISRIFLPKSASKLRQSRLKVIISGQAPDDCAAGYLDGAITKLVDKVRVYSKDVMIKDDRVDQTTRYRRNTRFTYKKKFLELDIKDEYAVKIVMISSDTTRKSSVKFKNNKVNHWLVLKKIKEMVETEV